MDQLVLKTSENSTLTDDEIDALFDFEDDDNGSLTASSSSNSSTSTSPIISSMMESLHLFAEKR